jgi:hypothetical protein
MPENTLSPAKRNSHWSRIFPIESGTETGSGSFENESAGEKILRGLIEKVGSDDRKNRLRLSIVRDVNKRKPYVYRVLLTENIEVREGTRATVTGRIHTMEPSSSVNLDRFLSVYLAIGSYVLSFGVLATDEQGLRPPKNEKGLTILKHNLNLVDAWTVGPNSLEVSAIAKDDDPFIPEGVEAPPVLDVLDFLKQH